MATTTVDNIERAKRACSHLGKSMSGRDIGDYQPFFDSLADDVAFEYASPEGAGALHGKQAVIDYITNAFATLSDPNLEEDVELQRPLEYLGNGDRVVILWREGTRNKKTGELSPGKEVAVVLDFRDGLIARLLRFAQ